MSESAASHGAHSRQVGGAIPLIHEASHDESVDLAPQVHEGWLASRPCGDAFRQSPQHPANTGKPYTGSSQVVEVFIISRLTGDATGQVAAAPLR